jgi:hypothetical protein
VHIGFLWGKPEGECLENLDVYGRILLKWISKKWLIGVIDWLSLVQDRDR